MKKFLKTIFLLAGVLICVEVANEEIMKNVQKQTVTNDTIKGDAHIVCATMYYAVPSQCDSDPLTTAGMYQINPKKASEHKWIAMSRNMIARWGGEFKYGDYVQIKGAGHKDGVYKVVDTINKRFTNRIDFLETKGTKPYKFNNVTLAKITWKQENLLASL